ncbi:MAG: radical SAM protein [bacterium]
MDSMVIKPTRSLCPLCLEEIDAQVVVEGGKVVMAKDCRSHGRFTNTLDPDARLYLSCVAARRRRHSPYGLVIPITHRCNLRCRWCYLPDKGLENELSRNEIKAIIDRSRQRYIVFSGGEPTVRDDLPELIAYVRKNHRQRFSVLLTNGIKLADRAYLEILKEAGLHYVILSLNGFRKETHCHFCGEDLREAKCRALRNLKDLKVWTILSMTLAKGVNEGEFGDIYRFGMRNLDFIRQIRLRNVSEIGIYHEGSYIYLSEMIKLVSKATGLSIQEMCETNDSCNRIFKTGNYFVIDVLEALGKRYGTSRGHGTRYWLHILHRAGMKNALKLRIEPPGPRETRLMLRVEIFFWPKPGNIDLAECRLFCIDHLSDDGEVLPFWEALYRNERLHRRLQCVRES